MSIRIMDDLDLLMATIRSATAKLKVAVDEGPESPNVVLTPAEATVVYRLFTEQLGLVVTERY
jgi:hypothetical protein